MTSLQEAALAYLRAGISILPCELPEKNPAYHLLPRVRGKPEWGAWKTRLPTEEEVRTWFADQKPPAAIGIIGGAVSGNLEILDIDDAQIVKPFADAVRSIDPQLLAKLVVEKTIRGRAHVIYRCSSPVPGSRKLAVASLEEGAKGLIETKGEGGYACVAPSPGYDMIKGDIACLPVITTDEREILIQVGRAFTRAAQVEDQQPQAPGANASLSGTRPGDEYNASGRWRALLETHGWTRTRGAKGVEHWRRPGKDKGGLSATWGHVLNAFYVFTTNGHPLQDGRAYSPFALLTLLEYAGDYSAAAKALWEANRGPRSFDARRPEPPPPYPPHADTDAQSGAETATAMTEEQEEHAPPPMPDHLRLVPDDPSAQARPQLYAGQGDLGRMVDHAWDALALANTPPRLFVFGQSVVAASEDEYGQARLRPLNPDSMRDEMARSARWFLTRPGKRGQRPEKYDAKPPADVARVLLAGDARALPRLDRMVMAPIVSKTGRVVDREGYDPETRTYRIGKLSTGGAIPARPTDTEVAQARDLLLDDLLGDFPFASGASVLECPDRAHALAMFILPFARDTIDGPTPLHLVEKPTPGSGASLLFQVLGRIVTGGDPATITEARDDDEWRKRITSTLLRTPPLVAFDNLRRTLDSAALATALTTSTWEDRRLGASENVLVPVRTTWVATGNNPQVSNEIARRCVSIRIDPRMERPWERGVGDFRHPNLLQWTIANRGRLVRALLVLIRAWVARGMPDGQRSLGSYERWAGVIGGILETAGLTGFLDNRQEFYDRADRETDGWLAFLDTWQDTYGDTPTKATTLFELVESGGLGLDLGGGTKHSQAIRLGRILRSARGKRITVEDRLVTVERGALTRNAWLWRLAPVGGASDGGDSGSKV